MRWKRRTRFATYADALAACGKGYDSSVIAEVVTRKTLAAADNPLDFGSAARTLAALAFAPPGPLRVLDFGGAAGYHYLVARRAFPDRRLDWVVVETPAMVKAAPDIGARFVTSVGEARSWLGEVDLAFASGSLQYVPDPLATVRDLAGARCLFITRTALSLDGTRVEVQESRLADNGPGIMPAGVADAVIRYPVTFVDRDDFEATLAEIYEIRLRLDEGAERSPMFGYVAYAAS